MSRNQSHGAALAEYALAMSISGTIGAFVIGSGQSAINTVFARCVIGGVLLGIYVIATRSLSQAKFTKASLVLLAVIASSIVVNWVCLFSSYRYAPIGMVTMIYHLQPVMVFIAGSILFGEVVSKIRLTALLLAVGGALLIIMPNEADDHLQGVSVFTGYGLAFLAAIFYTAATLAGKKLAGVPAPVTALCQLALGSVVLAPFVDYKHLPDTDAEWACLATLGVVHSAFMYILIYSSYKKLQTSQIAVLGYLYPLVALLVDALYFNRSISILQICGCILIACSGLCISMPPAKKITQKASVA